MERGGGWLRAPRRPRKHAPPGGGWGGSGGAEAPPRQYQSQPGRGAGQAAGFGDFSDFFNTYFSGEGGGFSGFGFEGTRGRTAIRERGEDIEHPVGIALEQAARGGDGTI